jgi:hypothetical protein
MNLLRKIGRIAYKWWMVFARALAIVNTTVLLTLVYVFLIGPASVIARLLRKDLMKHRMNRTGSFWKTKEPVAHTLDQSRHQF